MRALTEPLILLAGGRSRRAGQPKGLREYRGRPWLLEQLERFQRAGGKRVILVLGHEAEAYGAQLAQISVPGLSFELALNPRPEDGPFSSIQQGLLRSDGGAFVQPIDVPCPAPEVWRELCEKPGLLAALPALVEGGGHPVWISSELASDLLTRPGTSRLDEILKALPEKRVARVPVWDPSVRMNLNTPEDWAAFREASELADDTELGHDAGLLSLIEVGLGSVLHAFHVPGAGHFLSLNQSFFLSRSTLRLRSRSAGLRISTIAGLLKSLSPAGKRLTPMLAISMQGALFSAGVAAFGANVAGVCVGAALSSAWAFVQPLLVSYLIFGKSLFEVLQVVYDRAAELVSFPKTDLWHVLGALIAAKMVLAVGVALGAAFAPESWASGYLNRLRAMALRSRGKTRKDGEARAVWRELLRPIFLVPLLLNFIFLFWAESRHAAFVWGLLRPLAIGYGVFFLFRWARSWAVFSAAFRSAVRFLDTP